MQTTVYTVGIKFWFWILEYMTMHDACTIKGVIRPFFWEIVSRFWYLKAVSACYRFNDDVSNKKVRTAEEVHRWHVLFHGLCDSVACSINSISRMWLRPILRVALFSQWKRRVSKALAIFLRALRFHWENKVTRKIRRNHMRDIELILQATESHKPWNKTCHLWKCSAVRTFLFETSSLNL